MRQKRVTFFLAAILFFSLVLSFGIRAQSDQNQEQGTLDILKALTERSQSRQMLDLMVGQSQNRFLDDYVDPDKYIVGPGDGFGINFLSSDIKNIDCRINSDGRIFIKSVGAIELGHVTLSEALEAIRREVSENYDRAQFTIQLNNHRFSKINILGEVRTPGIYYVPATWRVSEVIGLAGGLTPKASMRKITLSGFNNKINVDLVRYYHLAETDANAMICRGKTLLIPMVEANSDKVSVSGKVNNASIYEYMAGDKIADYLRFSGGINGRSEDMEISIYSAHEGGEETVIDGATGDLSKIVSPSEGTNINVRLKVDHKNQIEVMIFGAISQPGRYALNDSENNLEYLLNRSGGLTEQGSSEMIQVFRLIKTYPGNYVTNHNGNGINSEPNRFTGRHIMSHNPRQAYDFTQINLDDGDSVFVPTATGMVTVTGAVAYPGLVTFRPDQKVDYYIRAAGGYTNEADKAKIVVISNYSDGRIDAKAAGSLFDGETVMVPRKETRAKP